jgi:SAM-dependent methyltransferase
MYNKPWFYNEQFLKEHQDKINGRVVDIGCGQMKYRKMIEEINNVEEYIGVDYYESKGVKIVADLNKTLPIEDDSFDTAICISVVEHLLEPQLALNEICRILKPGSYLLLSTPWIFPFHNVPDDYFRFSGKALNYMLEKAGFKIIENYPTGGKIRIISIFLVFWFPIFKKIQPFFRLYCIKNGKAC